MKRDDSLTWLCHAVADAMAASMTFQTSGELPAIDPGIVVDGLGALKFPLKPADVKRLKAGGHIATYGKGSRTLVNPAVRDTIELDPDRFQVSDEWRQAIHSVTRQIGKDLGLDGEQLEAHLYKLLIYEKGGHFLSHRDSEKLDGMVASLIVVLPNPFYGGGLEVRHAGNTRHFDFSSASSRGVTSYVAFYADCKHEVKRVDSGVRMCLAYNLVLRQPQKPPVPSAPGGGANPLADVLRHWFATQPVVPLVFALEHQYTPASLSQALLKGADRSLAKLVLSATAQSDGVATFAQLERHTCHSAFEGDDGHHDYHDDDDDDDGDSDTAGDYEIQELIEQEFSATGWTDPDGKKHPWGSLPLDISAVVCRTPVEEWAPTDEEYEGYTGNAGNTLDRWYHRTALIVWPRSRHYEILATAGMHTAMPMFVSMVKKLPKARTASENGRDEARSDCINLARGIILRWPVRWASHGGFDKTCEAFPARLLLLQDRDLIRQFLAEVNLHDEVTPLDGFIIGAVRRFGWDAFANELTAFFRPRESTRYAQRNTLALRDAAWLCKLAVEASTDTAKAPLIGKLCKLATDLFCKQGYNDWGHRHGSGPASYEQTVPLLAKASLMDDKAELVTRVLERIRKHPGSFRNQTCHVPALRELAPWSRKQFPQTPPVIVEWLRCVRDELTAATGARPRPPGDWRRSSDMGCNCGFCGKIKVFLADPHAQTYSLRAAEGVRAHVTGRISNKALDLTSKLQKSGSPYALVLTKTSESHARAVKQYDVDVALLNALPTLT